MEHLVAQKPSILISGQCVECELIWNFSISDNCFPSQAHLLDTMNDCNTKVMGNFDSYHEQLRH